MVSWLVICALLHGRQIEACPPLRILRVTSGYGWRRHPVDGGLRFHRGVDYHARSDTVFCVLPGTVSVVGFHARLGRYVKIDHGPLTTVYGHLAIIGVQPGQLLDGGEPIAITGATGLTTGEHLHFEVRLHGIPINPNRLFQTIYD